MAVESVVGSAIGVANTLATGAMLIMGYIVVMAYNRFAHRGNLQNLKLMRGKNKPKKSTFKSLVVPEINKIKVTSSSRAFYTAFPLFFLIVTS